MTDVVLILQVVMFAVLVWLVWRLQRTTYTVDARRIAERLAMDLLADWQHDVVILDEGKTKQFVLNKYVQLCAEYGLPEAAAGKVAGHVWQFVAEQQKHLEQLPTEAGFGFYE